MPSHSLHAKWALRIIGDSLRDVDLMVDKIEIHDYPCRGTYYPYKALQLGYILFKKYGCSAVKAMYLHCAMDSIDLFLKQKNIELRDKGYFKLDGKVCYAKSMLAKNKWLWACRDEDNPFLGMTLTQEQIEERLEKVIKDKVMELLNNYLEAVKEAIRLVKNGKEINLPRELLRDIMTVASNQEFIKCAYTSLVDLKSKLSNKKLFKEMVNDIGNEAVNKVHTRK